jgi:hypothetical protein
VLDHAKLDSEIMQGARAKFEGLCHSVSVLEQKLNLLQLNIDAQKLESEIKRKLKTVHAYRDPGNEIGLCAE